LSWLKVNNPESPGDAAAGGHGVVSESRTILLRHLDDARAQVAVSEKLIARQREVVAELEQAGRGDQVGARQLLERYLQLHAEKIAEAERLERAIHRMAG
jgi:hypothetical protein